MTPHPLSASPPTAEAGTGRGWGGSPAVGTSEESTAGGVETLYGQLLGSGPAAGSAEARTGEPTMKRVAVKAAARRSLVIITIASQVRR